MLISVSNQKYNVDALIEDIENHVLIMKCNESFRFKDHENVKVTLKHNDVIVADGKVLASNQGHLYVIVSESTLNQLQLAERRKFVRYNLEKPIYITIFEHHANGITKRYRGYIRDVSLEGMKITSEFPLRIKQNYEIIVESSDPNLTDFVSNITVKNARLDYEYDDKVFGTTLEEMSMEAQIKLEKFINILQQKTYEKPSLLHKIRALIS